MAHTVKNLPEMQNTWVRSLGQEDPQRRERLPTPVFLLGEFHGQRAWWATVQGIAESDMTEQPLITETEEGVMGGSPILGLTGWAEVQVIMVKNPEGVSTSFGEKLINSIWISFHCGFMEHSAGNVQ